MQYAVHGEVDSLRDFLASIPSKLKKRNKLIKLADPSQAGWAIVEETKLMQWRPTRTNPIKLDWKPRSVRNRK